LRDLRWQLDALPLLIGRMNGRIQTRLADGFAEARVRSSFAGRVELRDVQLATSLSALAPVVPIGDVRGQVTVRLERLELIDGLPASIVGQANIGELRVPTFIPGGRGDLIPLG